MKINLAVRHLIDYSTSMAKTPTLQAWIALEKLDYEGNTIGEDQILVEGDYTPACKGSRGDYGVPMEPDYDEEVKFICAMREDGEEVELNKEEMDVAMAALWKAIPERDYDEDRED